MLGREQTDGGGGLLCKKCTKLEPSSGGDGAPEFFVKSAKKGRIDIDALREMAASGLYGAEIARRLGVTRGAVHHAAKRHGITLRDGRSGPEVAAAIAEEMRRKNSDPEFVAARAAGIQRFFSDPDVKVACAERMRRLQGDPAFNPLAALTAAERADYDILKRRGGLRRAGALRAIGRADLIGGGA